MHSSVSKLPALRALVVAFVLFAGMFIVLLQAQTAAAQGTETEIVIGLQNDMTTMNYWNPETNTVWNYYQTGLLVFEGLFSNDPDFKSFPVLADKTKGATGPGFTIVQTSPYTIVDVFVRQNVKFHDGTTMTADDVVFSYQVKAWSTEQTSITEALWWDAPTFPHWSGTGVSHIGVQKMAADTVRFSLSKPYALFFLSTLEVTIIPKAIWQTHIDPNPPVNISNPTQRISDSADLSMDFSFGRLSSQTAATIGTGFFKFDSWSPNQGSHLTAFADYWGKAEGVVWRSVSYPFYPEHLRSIQFVIYTSLDVISLALQKGEIDTLIWSLTPGFLSQVRSNPAISVEQVTDAGYFYLSFNLRRKPWNDLHLRQAISMAIDKDYIVNTLMGGFGVKGAAPVSLHTIGYFNSSAVPPSFDLNAARALLDQYGMVDQNGDGFRDYSDGSPIKATILTPPKDYDPVRADAGIMISNNLKQIGLNIDAAPTSFDTIVAKAFTEVDFDIYILGWLLQSTPETYLSDFFASKNDVAINPAGSNSAGYHNTQVDTLLAQMLVTLDDNTRIQIVKQIEGIVTADIPWNVLYYRKNLNAYRNDAWVGWVNTPPQLYNFWSLVKIRPAGVTAIPPPSGAFNVAMTVPERALSGHTVPVDVFVSQNLLPVSGASVSLNATWGSEYRVMTGTTDVGGHARFDWVAPVIQGAMTLTASVTKGTNSATTTKRMEITVGPPAPIATLSLSTLKPVIGTGETTTITATLINGVGGPLAGATVSIDKTLVLGNVTPASAQTDATGKAAFTYTAPANAGRFPNQHLADFIKATTSVPDTVAVDTQGASMVIFVENDNAPDWRIVALQGPTPDLVLSSVVPSDSTTLTVKVTDFAGVALVGEVVEAVLPADNYNVSVTPATATTIAGGLATFTLSVTASAEADLNSTNVGVRFAVVNDPYSVSDQIELFLADATSVGYASWLSLDKRGLTSEPQDTATATLTVYNQLGLAASNVPAILQISYGDLGLAVQFPWDYDYANFQYLGAGLDLNSFGQGTLGGSFESSPVIGDPTVGTMWGVENFVEDLEVVGSLGVVDSCDPSTWPAGFDGLYYINATSVTDTNGQLSVPFSTLPHRIDTPIQVRGYVGDPLGAEPLRVTADACNFVSSIDNALFRVDSGAIVQRAPVFALGSVVMDQPVLTSLDRVGQATATFYKRGGVVASNAEVFLIRGAGSAGRNIRGAFGGTIAADSAGVLRWNVSEQSLAAPPLSLSQPVFFSYVPADARYAYGGREQLFAGAYGDYWFAPTFASLIAKVPFEFRVGYLYVPTGVAFANVAVDKTIVNEGGTVIATVSVTTGTGTPIANATVWSGSYQVLTDAAGEAAITYTAGAGAIENLAVITTPDGQIIRAWYGVLASGPVLAYSALTVTPKQAGQASDIVVTATNQLPISGTATVTLMVGGQTAMAQEVAFAASESKTVTFRYVFTQAGDFSVAVGGQTGTASIPAAPAPPVDVLVYALSIGLLVVGLVVGAVVGMMMARRGKKPPTGMEEPMEQAKPAEEELGPEEKL